MQFHCICSLFPLKHLPTILTTICPASWSCLPFTDISTA
uniref:Uncharacterized protein n=1 Tax=Anguilla anguilla TaxID=7936 RepID=A0A0E9S2W6_ANGAN